MLAQFCSFNSVGVITQARHFVILIVWSSFEWVAEDRDGDSTKRFFASLSWTSQV